MRVALARHTSAAVALVALAAALLSSCDSTCFSTPWGLKLRTGPDRPPIDERDAGDAGRFGDGTVRGCRRPADGPLYPEGTIWGCDDPDICTTCTGDGWCECPPATVDGGAAECTWARAL